MKIILNNFLSFKQTEIELNGLTAIIGKNNITGGSNGAGKSSIIDGICFALFGDTVRKVSDKRLVKKGEKDFIVSIDLNDLQVKRTLTTTKITYKGKDISCDRKKDT